MTETRAHPRRGFAWAIGPAVGVGLALVALGGRGLLEPVFGAKFPYAINFYAVIVAAWWRGGAAGLTAAVVGVLLCSYLWVEPRGSPAIASADERLGLVLNLTASSVISMLGAARQRAMRREREKHEALRASERELARHRDNLEKLVEQRTQELLDARQRAVLAQRMAAVGTLAAGLAHDLKNLTLPLGMRLESLRMSAGLDGEVRQELALIAALLDHTRTLSENLSLFARDPDREGGVGRTDLAAWRGRVGKLLDASIGPAAKIAWDFPDGLPEAAIAPHRLTQVVQNLVHNARDAIATKHPAPGPAPADGERGGPLGRIAVEARPGPGSGPGSGPTPGRAWVILKVRDDGCGMDEETRRRCIEPFFSTKDRPSAAGAVGSGLGLSLAHQIVEHTGGAMEIESEPGKGTTITLRLPIGLPPEPAEVHVLAGRSADGAPLPP